MIVKIQRFNPEINDSPYFQEYNIVRRIAPDNKREKQAPKQKIKIFYSGVAYPRPRYATKRR
jgi:hypothetical protein